MIRLQLSPRVIAVAVAALGTVSAGAWWLTSGESAEPEETVQLPPELTKDSLRTQAMNDPSKLMKAMSSVDRDDLTQEQRQAARRNMRQIVTERLDKNIDEYFAASEAQKQAILDKQIDEFMEWRKKMREAFEARRAQREAERKQRGDEQPSEDQQQQRRRRFLGDQGERKARAESRSADKMARRMAYFAAARARMAERGIDGGFGRGGRRRGGNGGGGGGGGRPGRPR